MSEFQEALKATGRGRSNYEIFMSGEFPKLQSCKVIDIEITRTDVTMVNLFVRSAATDYRMPMKVEEALRIVDDLLRGGFVIVASGKERSNGDARSQEVFGTLNSWFIRKRPILAT